MPAHADEIEAIEIAALEDLVAAADGTVRAELSISPRRIGDAYVVSAAVLPTTAIVINRAIGLGLAAPASHTTIEQIAAHYSGAGVERYFVHVHPDAQPAAIGDWLEDCGLARARGWAKFTRGRDALAPASSTLDIRPADASDTRAFGRRIRPRRRRR